MMWSHSKSLSKSVTRNTLGPSGPFDSTVRFNVGSTSDWVVCCLFCFVQRVVVVMAMKRRKMCDCEQKRRHGL